jgi:hypothetical protein
MFLTRLKNNGMKRTRKVTFLFVAIEVPAFLAFSWALTKHPGNSRQLTMMMALFILALFVVFAIILTVAFRRDREERVVSGKVLPAPKPFVIAIFAIWGFVSLMNTLTHLRTIMQMGRTGFAPITVGLLFSGFLLYVALSMYLRRKRMLNNDPNESPSRETIG